MNDKRFKVILVYTDEVVLATDNYKEAIKELKRLEQKDYNSYLDYCQRCYDNYEDPTIDERPGDYYSTYYIKDEMCTRVDRYGVCEGLYDITDYCRLEREMKQL